MIAIKFIQQIFEPLIFIFALMVLAIILINKDKTRALGKKILIATAILYYMLGISPIANALIAPLEKSYQTPAEIIAEQNDVLIIFLTGGYENDLLRSEKLLDIYTFSKKGGWPAQIIISGINPLNSEVDELTKFADWLITAGVSPEDIKLDPKSRNTFESAQNISALIGQKQFFLVTSAYHMPRAMMAFKSFGTRPIAAAADYKTKGGINVFDLLPSAEGFEISATAIHEYIGIIYYKLKFVWKI